MRLLRHPTLRTVLQSLGQPQSYFWRNARSAFTNSPKELRDTPNAIAASVMLRFKSEMQSRNNSELGGGGCFGLALTNLSASNTPSPFGLSHVVFLGCRTLQHLPETCWGGVLLG